MGDGLTFWTEPLAAPTEIAEQIADAEVGVVFTVRVMPDRAAARISLIRW